ncbi:MAG TPA: hypothetical protein VGF76_18300, partial [Polyangiaceae bacterium]
TVLCTSICSAPYCPIGIGSANSAETLGRVAAHAVPAVTYRPDSGIADLTTPARRPDALSLVAGRARR